jgi:hypothetical protein
MTLTIAVITAARPNKNATIMTTDMNREWDEDVATLILVKDEWLHRRDQAPIPRTKLSPIATHGLFEGQALGVRSCSALLFLDTH